MAAAGDHRSPSTESGVQADSSVAHLIKGRVPASELLVCMIVVR